MSGTGKVYFGPNSILGNLGAPPVTNTITANGANVTFTSATGRAASAITLNGDVTINTNPVSFNSDSSANDEMVVDTGDDGQDAGVDGNTLVDALQ